MPENQGTEPFEDDPELQEQERLAELERADAAAVLDDDLDDDEIHFVGPEAAMQRLTGLTGQLGLYEDTDAAGEPRQVAVSCPFCGRPDGTCRHRPGGPA